jgi:hypothetical protein
MDQKDIKLEDLNYFWMPNGVPCFVANVDNICDIIESFGFQIYYLLANNIKETKVTTTSYNNNYGVNSQVKEKSYGYGASWNNTPTTVTTTKEERSAKMFKVVTNFVGRSVSISDDELPKEFIDMEEECLYTMPLIPLDIVNKLDDFFRLVHLQHGTESIIILTYDMDKKDSSGWGILVPEQTNTAAHCKYDADSIATMKPDNVMIVGSVHSHPEMAAYASGTDHDDQADFDGVHITYGWQKTVNNGSTQYYAELQMSGKAYKLNIEDVLSFETIKKEPHPEVVEWSTKVKKSFPLQSGGSLQSIPNNSPIITPNSIQTGQQDGVYKKNREIMLSGTNYKNLLADINLPFDSVIVTEIDLDSHGNGYCLMCESSIDNTDLISARCRACDSPIVSPEDHIATIIEKVDQYMIDYYLPDNTPIYLFTNDKGLPSIMKINEHYDRFIGSFSHKKSVSSDLSSIYDDSFSDELSYVHIPTDTPEELELFASSVSRDYLVCCGIKIADADSDCYCSIRVYPNDLSEFDDLLQRSDVYKGSSVCHSCGYFYDSKCPAYREILTEYVAKKTIFDIAHYSNSIEGCSNYSHYTQVNLSRKGF